MVYCYVVVSDWDFVAHVYVIADVFVRVFVQLGVLRDLEYLLRLAVNSSD